MLDRLRVSCPEGDFAVESNDEDEIVQIIQSHAEDEHDLSIDRSEIEAMIEDEEEAAGIE